MFRERIFRIQRETLISIGKLLDFRNRLASTNFSELFPNRRVILRPWAIRPLTNYRSYARCPLVALSNFFPNRRVGKATWRIIAMQIKSIGIDLDKTTFHLEWFRPTLGHIRRSVIVMVYS
jgi:hypothetical protein